MRHETKIIKNYIYDIMYRMLTLISPLITAPYVARVLGASGVGIYNYTQSIATYFVYVCAMGTTVYGQREIAYNVDILDKRSETFWEIAIFRLVASIICSIVFFFVFCRSGEYAPVYTVLVFEILAAGFDISWFFMGMENFKVTVMRNSIIRILGIILVFAVVRMKEHVVLYTVCMTLPILIGNLSLWVSLPKHVTKVAFSNLKLLRHVKPALILFLPQLAIEVYAILDKTLLGKIIEDISQVGYYSQASRIIKLTLTVVTSLGTVMFPAMSAAFARGDHTAIQKSVQKAFQIIFMLSAAIMFGIIAVSKNFVPIFFGPGYESVIILMIIMSPVLLIVGSSNVIGRQYLLPTKQEKYFTASVVMGAVVNVLVNIILIPKFGAVGTAIATVCAEISVTAAQMFLVRKQLLLWVCFKPMLRYVFYGCVMCAATYTFGSFLGGGVLNLCLQIVFGMLAYGAVLIIMRDPLVNEGLEMLKKRRYGAEE